MLDAHFSFEPIGQGCFYNGTIHIYNGTNIEFTFVYDCGTDSKMSYLEKQINIYKDSLKDKTIDLVIISHFDADHVNGIVQLLNGVHCKRLIIPYYEPIERLILYTTTTSEDDGYRQILQNPINYFGGDQFQIDEIILIGGPDDSENIANINPNKIPFDKLDVDSINKIEKLKFTSLCLDRGDEDAFVKKIIKRENYKISNPQKLKVLKKPYSVRIDVWEFIFYLKKHDNYLLINKFQKDVDVLLAKENIELRDLFDEENVKELKKVYRDHFGQNLNTTSLVTYHGPLFDGSCYTYFISNSNFTKWDKDVLGTLLTGDIDINSRIKLQKMLDYFVGQISKVCVFQVPHHVSKHNWSFLPPNGLESFNNYVINHGLGRAHHPSIEVVDYIYANCTNGILHLNNEVCEFEYGFHLLQ